MPKHTIKIEFDGEEISQRKATYLWLGMQNSITSFLYDFNELLRKKAREYEEIPEETQQAYEDILDSFHALLSDYNLTFLFDEF